ncbi:MAG: hypothetical protein VCB42_01725 [Myxococcota bacterium]
MKRVSYRIAGLVAALVVTASLHAAIPATTRAERGGKFIPLPEVARALSFGFDAALADFYWLWAVQTVGQRDADLTRDARDLSRLIDVVTTLDPWVDHPYRFAAVWLTDSEQSVREANRLLERGIAHHPDDWRNRYHLGFNHFFYLQENRRAADVLEGAVRLPGAPAYLPRLVARLRSKDGNLEAAGVFLEEMVRTAADDLERAQLQSALDEIEVEYRARSLDRARGVYRERNGRDIASVADLVEGPGAVLAHLPSAAPSSQPISLRNGAEWTLEPDTRRIVSDYYGRRYEISVHALDRQRNQEWRRLREGASDDA